MAATHANKLFRHDEVARIVGPDEIDVISPVSAAYGLAIILDSNSAVVDYVQKDDAPRKLQPDELALIATDGLLRVSYLSGVPNVNDNKEVGVRIDQLTEEDGISGKERTIRGKVVLEFRIDRYSRKIANHLHDLMRDSDSDRLTKKEFLESFGDDTKDNIANFIQTFIDENGRPKGGPRFKARGRADLSPTLEEYGVEFRNILCNVDRRSNLARAIWPSFQYDHKVVVAAKLVAYAISITSSAIGLLFAADILPIRPSPMVTIEQHINGTASITGNDCQAGQMCTVERGGRVTVSAMPASNYALTGWNCPECSNDLGEENPVVISGITDDLAISPIFKPLATVNVISADTQLGRVNCEIKGVRNPSCRGVPGQIITLKAEVNELGGSQADQLVNVFNMWENCQIPWCNSDDLDKPEIPLIVPTGLSSPETVNVRANFRQDRLIKLRVNPAEPSSAGLGRPTVTRCSTSPSCDETREGIADVYVFQQNSDSSLPLDLSAPVPDVTSPYEFDSWICNGQPCSLLDDPQNPTTSIELDDDVTITPTYAEQIVIIIDNQTSDGSVEYIGSLPSGCVRTSASTHCRFPVDGFTSPLFNIVAEPDNSDDFRASWECDGNRCGDGDTFNQRVDMSLTLAPVFTKIQRSRLDWSSSLLGRIAPSLKGCEPDNCMGMDEWSVEATVPEEKDDLRFKEWDCDPQSACTNSTNHETTVKLNNQDVSIRPIFERIPTLTLEGPGVSCDPICSALEGNSIDFFVNVPRMMRFTGWECSGNNSLINQVFCDRIDDRSIPDTLIHVGNLSADTTVILTPHFEEIPEEVFTLTLEVGEGGYVRGTPNETDCMGPRTCTYRMVSAETTLELSARNNSTGSAGRVITGSPDPRWSLERGESSGYTDSGNGRVSVIVTEITELKVEFLRELDVYAGTGGYIKSEFGRCDEHHTCSYEVPIGKSVNIEAVIDDGYAFDEWDLDSGSGLTPNGRYATVKVTEDTEVNAYFKEAPKPSVSCDANDITGVRFRTISTHEGDQAVLRDATNRSVSISISHRSDCTEWEEVSWNLWRARSGRSDVLAEDDHLSRNSGSATPIAGNDDTGLTLAQNPITVLSCGSRFSFIDDFYYISFRGISQTKFDSTRFKRQC